MSKNSNSNSNSNNYPADPLEGIIIPSMELKPVGVINSPYTETYQAPRQGRNTNQISQITIFNRYSDALDGIERHKYIIVIYWLDRAERNLLKVVPAGKSKKRGVFSTRAPSRPNPLALSLAEIIDLRNTEHGIKINVKGLEALDGSIVVDIKPFVKAIDCVDDI